jgi:O-antigen ligase
VERASRLVVILSLLTAGGVHAWLASGRAWLTTAVVAAFAIGAAAGRLVPDATLAAVSGLTYVAPALLFVAFGASDYHTLAIWLAPMAGLTLANTSWSRWSIADPWRLPVVAWALVVAVSWPIVAGREIDFSLLAARTYDTTTSAYQAPPRLAAAWIVMVAVTQLTAVLWFDLLWSRFARPIARLEAIVVRPLLAGACLGALAGIYQSTVDLTWMNLPDWSNIGRVGGLMLDANTAAMTAVLWAPVAVALALGRGARLWPGVAIYLLLLAGMWGTGSRTGLLALSIGTAGVIVAAGERAGVPRRRMVFAALAAAAIVGAAALAIAPRTAFGSPLRRVFDRLPSLEAGDLRRFGDELWMRFGYGKAAAAMTADHPVSGVGVGAFHVVVPDYLYRDGRLHPVPDNAQNWWRHQIAELGVAGALPLLWLSLLVAHRVWRGWRTPHDPPRLVIACVLAGVGIASLLGVPTQHPATLISFLTLLFWLTATWDRGDEPGRVAAARWRWSAAFALAALVAAGQARAAAGDLGLPRRAQKSGLPFAYGVTAPEGLSEFGEFRWAAGRGVSVQPPLGPWLQLTIWTAHPDVASRPVHYEVALDGRAVVSADSHDREPRTYYLQMPRGERMIVLEFAASRDVHRDRALQLATAWIGAPPADAPPDRVIPQ